MVRATWRGCRDLRGRCRATPQKTLELRTFVLLRGRSELFTLSNMSWRVLWGRKVCWRVSLLVMGGLRRKVPALGRSRRGLFVVSILPRARLNNMSLRGVRRDMLSVELSLNVVRRKLLHVRLDQLILRTLRRQVLHMRVREVGGWQALVDRPAESVGLVVRGRAAVVIGHAALGRAMRQRKGNGCVMKLAMRSRGSRERGSGIS